MSLLYDHKHCALFNLLSIRHYLLCRGIWFKRGNIYHVVYQALPLMSGHLI